IGIIEMIIITAWTKVVSDTKVIASGIITFINILIWYYVLQVIVEDINNWQLVLLYALGCSLGTILTTLFFKGQEKKNHWLTKLKNRLPW
ncbi:MAG TPA: DUF5698 domain-containing protein, partial [Patescibacteria group bacterium]|nr:DUF5698 domain-containing protein [Patescibacteria group bacterium]